MIIRLAPHNITPRVKHNLFWFFAVGVFCNAFVDIGPVHLQDRMDPANSEVKEQDKDEIASLITQIHQHLHELGLSAAA